MITIPYDDFIKTFLLKIREYEFLKIPEIEDRNNIVDNYLMLVTSDFDYNNLYNLVTTRNNELRQFEFIFETEEEEIDFKKQLDKDIYEIINIVTDGMVLKWMKPFVNNQEILESILNTRDFTTYSPAELLKQVSNSYNNLLKEYKQEVKEYSYNHGNLRELHL